MDIRKAKVSPATISLLMKKASQQMDVLGMDRNAINIYERLPHPFDDYGVSVRIEGGSIFRVLVIELHGIPKKDSPFVDWLYIKKFMHHNSAESIAHDMTMEILSAMAVRTARDNYKYVSWSDSANSNYYV